MKRYTERHTIDPITLKDIDDSNEWLMGRMEDEGAAEDDLVFEGDDLTWGDVARASGAEELRSLAKASKTPTPKPKSRPSSSKNTPTLAFFFFFLLIKSRFINKPKYGEKQKQP